MPAPSNSPSLDASIEPGRSEGALGNKGDGSDAALVRELDLLLGLLLCQVPHVNGGVDAAGCEHGARRPLQARDPRRVVALHAEHERRARARIPHDDLLVRAARGQLLRACRKGKRRDGAAVLRERVLQRSRGRVQVHVAVVGEAVCADGDAGVGDVDGDARRREAERVLRHLAVCDERELVAREDDGAEGAAAAEVARRRAERLLALVRRAALAQRRDDERVVAADRDDRAVGERAHLDDARRVARALETARQARGDVPGAHHALARRGGRALLVEREVGARDEHALGEGEGGDRLVVAVLHQRRPRLQVGRVEQRELAAERVAE
mmetsp:Transcript_2286/g.4317  ORF Transcript_2286/g.4317 Transcript_2286/m.4317 type:complete len:326 (-) Transcript_2286:930-1907(-)